MAIASNRSVENEKMEQASCLKSAEATHQQIPNTYQKKNKDLTNARFGAIFKLKNNRKEHEKKRKTDVDKYLNEIEKQGRTHESNKPLQRKLRISMVRFIEYLTPTKKEADQIKMIAFLYLHRRRGEPPFGLFTGKFEQEKPVERVGLYGNPDVFVHFVVGVTSPAISARSEEAWNSLTALYHKNP